MARLPMDLFIENEDKIFIRDFPDHKNELHADPFAVIDIGGAHLYFRNLDHIAQIAQSILKGVIRERMRQNSIPDQKAT